VKRDLHDVEGSLW